MLSDFGTVLFTTDHAQAQNSCRDSQRIIVSGSLSGCCDLMASVCCQQCSQPELAELQSKQSCRCDPANK